MSDAAAVLDKSSGLKLRFKDPKALEDPETLKALAELDKAIEENPLLNYNNAELVPLGGKVHAKQLAFHAIKSPPLGIKGLIAANRSGKTVACVVDDLIQILPEELVPEHLLAFKKFTGPIEIWIGAPKGENHLKNTIPLFKQFTPKAALKEGQWGKSFRSQPNPTLTLADGSVISFKTYDQDLDAWASAAVHRIHWDEEPNGEDGRYLRSEARARLISTGGDEIIGMTPLLGYSWVYDEVWERRDEEKVSVVQMFMDDNPWNSPEAIEEYARNLTEDEKRMRLRGEFVLIGGMVYPELDDHHFIERSFDELETHIKGQDVLVGIDPGVRTTAVVFVAFDSNNAALVFDELYLHNEEAIPENASEQIKSKLAKWKVKPTYFLIDPSSRNRSLTDAQRVQSLYQRAGIPAYEAQNDVETGVFEVKRRLERDLLLISSECSTLKWEMRRYRQDEKAKGRFAVVKENDHLCDCLRYAVMARPVAPAASPQRRSQQQWRPGIALPLRPRVPVDSGPYGKFS